MTQQDPVSIPLLPACKDGGIAELCENLKDAQQHPIVLDATDLGDVIPSLLLQTILSAERDWQSRDIEFAIANLSDESHETLTLLGLNENHFNSKVVL